MRRNRRARDDGGGVGEALIQAAGDGSFGQAELGGGFAFAHAVGEAADDDGAVFVGEAFDLLVDGDFIREVLRCACFPSPESRINRFSPARRWVWARSRRLVRCDAVEPGAEVFGADGFGFHGEDEEGCLEGVLGVLLVSQDTQGNPHDHWAVAFYDFGECSARPASQRTRSAGCDLRDRL